MTPPESERHTCSRPHFIIAVLVGAGGTWDVRAARPVARETSLQSVVFIFVQGLTILLHSLMVLQESAIWDWTFSVS